MQTFGHTRTWALKRYPLVDSHARRGTGEVTKVFHLLRIRLIGLGVRDMRVCLHGWMGIGGGGICTTRNSRTCDKSREAQPLTQTLLYLRTLGVSQVKLVIEGLRTLYSVCVFHSVTSRVIGFTTCTAQANVLRMGCLF